MNEVQRLRSAIQTQTFPANHAQSLENVPLASSNLLGPEIPLAEQQDAESYVPSAPSITHVESAPHLSQRHTQLRPRPSAGMGSATLYSSRCLKNTILTTEQVTHLFEL